MKRELTMKQHKVEAIGLWWLQWQADLKESIVRQVKERARRQAMSPRAFVSEHLAGSDTDSKSTSGKTSLSQD